MNFETMIQRFHKIFALKENWSMSQHEGVHVMTGFGVHAADEMRVVIVHHALKMNTQEGCHLSPDRVEEKIHSELIEARYDDFNARPSRLYNDTMHKITRGTQRLDPREVNALYALGLRMFENIEKRMGWPYSGLKAKDILPMTFEDHNYVEEAQAIKRQFEKPKNWVIEEKLLKAFARAAFWHNGTSREIPRPGQPWTERAL